MRHALYFTPPPGDPLTRTASGWLGRNAFSGEGVETPPVVGLPAQEIGYHTAAPRRYGFHATLKAPFRLADSAPEPELLAAIMRFCGDITPFQLPPLMISRLGPFFALTLSETCAPLQSFADAVVEHFEPFRAPLGEAELARRSSDRMSARELEYLHRWGYPYVFDTFRFHMTLTGPVEEGEAPRVERALQALFDPLLSQPVEVSSLALFIEPEPGAPFLVHSLHPLGRVERRRTASR